MSKPPSDATLLRRANADLRHVRREYAALRAETVSYRTRATKAETEVAEWKKRFDQLLARTPSDSTAEPTK